MLTKSEIKNEIIRLLDVIDDGLAEQKDIDMVNMLTMDECNSSVSRDYVNNIDDCLTLPLPQNARWTLRTPPFENGQFKAREMIRDYTDLDFSVSLMLYKNREPLSGGLDDSDKVIPASARRWETGMLLIWWTLRED